MTATQWVTAYVARLSAYGITADTALQTEIEAFFWAIIDELVNDQLSTSGDAGTTHSHAVNNIDVTSCYNYYKTRLGNIGITPDETYEAQVKDLLGAIIDEFLATGIFVSGVGGGANHYHTVSWTNTRSTTALSMYNRFKTNLGGSPDETYGDLVKYFFEGIYKGFKDNATSSFAGGGGGSHSHTII
jgi:hypothetical protein